MPNEELPDLVLARDQDEWLGCASALLFALTGGSMGRVERWMGHFKMLVQSYADLYKEGKIAKPYQPDDPKDALLARDELLRRYQQIEQYQQYLQKRAKELKKKEEQE